MSSLLKLRGLCYKEVERFQNNNLNFGRKGYNKRSKGRNRQVRTDMSHQ